MRVIALDGIGVSGSTAPFPLAIKALEDAGASVIRVDLRHEAIDRCLECDTCEVGACPAGERIDQLARWVSCCDAALMDLPASAGRLTPRGRLVLQRLATELPRADRGVRRIPVVVMTSTALPALAVRILGIAERPADEFRRILRGTCLRTVGALALTDASRRPNATIATRSRAVALGRRLASTCVG